MKAKLAAAVELRKNKNPEAASEILKDLLNAHPNDPDVNYQMAWTCDFMGKESDAVPYYEKPSPMVLRTIAPVPCLA